MRSTRSLVLVLVTFGLATFIAAGCSVSAAVPSWTFPAVHPASTTPMDPSMPMDPNMSMAPASQAASGGGAPLAGPTTRLDLAVVTGGMIGHTEFPAFIPSDFTLPANATVVVTVTNLDDATALPKGAEQYLKVTGTDGGTMTVTPIKVPSPNGAAGATTTLSALAPAVVSHTFTILALGINVPLAAHARTTFTIHTGAPGTYAWRCFVPCGADPMGWGTAMAAKSGFMEGTFTVA